jgi:hypothetical protein
MFPLLSVAQGDDVELKAQRWCAYSGYACVLVFMVGFALIAGFIPPPAPSTGARELAEQYRGDHTRILVGMVVAMFGAAFTGTWIAAITAQLRRVEGRFGVLTILQLAMGSILVLEFELCLLIWETGAFRVDRPDSEVQLMNDLGWITFIGLTGTAIVQCFAIAAVILLDSRPKPVYPRWVAFFNIWVALCFVPGSWNCLFKTGPIAWNGAFSFYVAMVAFLSWYLVNSAAMVKAIKAQEREQAQTPVPAVGPAGSPADGVDVVALAAEVAELRRNLDSLRPAAGSVPAS